jgi:hypothetical protein
METSLLLEGKATNRSFLLGRFPLGKLPAQELRDYLIIGSLHYLQAAKERNSRAAKGISTSPFLPIQDS